MSLLPGQNTPRSSQFATNPVGVYWSDGVTLFDGFLWVGIAIPSSSAWKFPFLSASTRLQRLPQFVKIPIINGAIDQTTQVFYNQDINPPGNKYVAYWFTSDGILITPASGTASEFTVSTAQTIINVPTLTFPTVPVDPVPQP